MWCWRHTYLSYHVIYLVARHFWWMAWLIVFPSFYKDSFVLALWGDQWVTLICSPWPHSSCRPWNAPGDHETERADPLFRWLGPDGASELSQSPRKKPQLALLDPESGTNSTMESGGCQAPQEIYVATSSNPWTGWLIGWLIGSPYMFFHHLNIQANFGPGFRAPHGSKWATPTVAQPSSGVSPHHDQPIATHPSCYLLKRTLKMKRCITFARNLDLWHKNLQLSLRWHLRCICAVKIPR